MSVKLYLGNIITMAEHKLRAEAIVVEDGIIKYVGSEKTARSFCDENVEVIDLGENTIYPGFMEGHCHPLGAGKYIDTTTCFHVNNCETMEEILAVLKDFALKNPNRELVRGLGYVENEVKPTAAMIDEIVSDRPVIIGTADGHSMWLNTKAMEKFGINKESVEVYGTSCVRVDENGEPTGYISEGPVFALMKAVTTSVEDGAEQLIAAQGFFLSKGYTAIYDAGVELIAGTCADMYQTAIKTGRYKMRTYGGHLVDENTEDIEAEVDSIVDLQKKYNNEYFKYIGVKTFADGVIEAHTGLLIDDYNDKPGYKGVERLTDHDKLVRVYKRAAENGLNVHVHTVGDGAIRCNLDAIEEAAALTGKLDQRNALAHLQLVNKDDIKRFADLNVIAVAAPLWCPKHKTYFPQEVEYVGKERAESAYPLKSFAKAEVTMAFHTDFPVSQNVSIPHTVYTAVMRKLLEDDNSAIRESDEAITRYEALAGMTRNVAYMWHEEDRLGSLEIGKVANMAVFDKDFLTDDIEEVYNSQLVCTIIDGDILYKNE